MSTNVNTIGKRLTKVSKTQMLTGGLEYFMIKTPESIVPGEATETVEVVRAKNRLWERLIEIVRTRANVVIVGILEDTGFSFAVEHVEAVLITELQDLMQGIDGTDAGVDMSGVTLEAVPEFRLVDPNPPVSP